MEDPDLRKDTTTTIWTTDISDQIENGHTISAIARTVTDIKDCKVSDIGPLHDQVCADSLNQIFEEDKASLQFQFDFEGLEITIYSSGDVRLVETLTG